MTPNAAQPAQPPVAAARSGRQKVSSWLSTILKILVAVLLIWWMISTGRLEPANLAGAFRHWDLLLGVAGLFYCQITITGLRWHLLLHSQDIRLPLKDTLALNMIGTLFNTVIPGAVGGDVMKGYYLSRRAPNRRTLAVTTLLVDRVLGLLALLMLPLIAAAWNRDLVMRSHPMQVLLYIAAGGVAAGFFGFLMALAVGSRVLAIIEPLAERFRPVKVFRKVLWAVVQYQHHTQVLLLCILISWVNHLLGTWAFLLCAQALTDVHFEISQFMLVVPLGLVTTAIPISPAGVGVGQAAFFTLFNLLPGLTGRLGSEACTLFQFVMVAVYLTGFIVYIFYRHESEPGTDSLPKT